MSKPAKNRFKGKGQVRLEKRMAFLEDELAHYEKLLQLDLDADQRRLAWCKREDTRVELSHVRAQLNALKPRCKPAPAMPLFKFGNKEI